MRGAKTVTNLLLRHSPDRTNDATGACHVTLAFGRDDEDKQVLQKSDAAIMGLLLLLLLLMQTKVVLKAQ